MSEDVQIIEHERSIGEICPSTTASWRKMLPFKTLGNANPWKAYKLLCNECNAEGQPFNE